MGMNLAQQRALQREQKISIGEVVAHAVFTTMAFVDCSHRKE